MIEGLNEIPELKGHDKVKLRVNGILTDLGFKKIEYGKNYSLPNPNDGTIYSFENEYKKDLTLYIYPSINQSSTYATSIFGEEIRNIKGFISSRSVPHFYNDFNMPDAIDLRYERKSGTEVISNITIGKYLKEQNIVIFLYPIFHNCDMKLEEGNEVLFYILDVFKKLCEENGVKKTNISVKVEDMLFKNFSKNIDRKKKEKKSQINNTLANIDNYQTNIINCHKNIIRYKTEIEGYENYMKNGSKIFKKEITEIKKLKFVKDVSIEADSIKVNIGDISIQFKDLDVYIGEFIVTIKPTTISIDVKERKKIWMFGEWNELIHPHINSTNTTSICWGERKNNTYELLAQMKFKDLIFWIRLWAKSYNPSDKYHAIGYWTGELGKPPESELERAGRALGAVVSVSDNNMVTVELGGTTTA